LGALTTLAAAGLAPTWTSAAEAGTTTQRVTVSPSAQARHRRPTRRLPVHSQRARVSIVGGNTISIGQAPWQVEVRAPISGGEELLCGGSILDETHILTAAHCTYDPETETAIPADEFKVFAGRSKAFTVSPEEQKVAVKSVRVHPYYDRALGASGGDDVAVLELEQTLTLSGPSARAIEPIAAGSAPPEGASVNLTGYGAESPEGTLTGALNSLGMTLVFSRLCGGEANALFLCASTPSGSLCQGDSGSALTTTGSPAKLVGVTDTVEIIAEEVCRDGAIGGFVNVAAPEIRDFILAGDETPPRAPRGGGAIIRGVITSGGSLTCTPGSWSNDPTITIAFVDGTSGQILQSGGSSTYTLSAADVGRRILCEVRATNAGGTGIGRTEALPPIQGAPRTGPPPPPVAVAPPQPVTVSEPGSLSLLSAKIAVRDNRVALLKLKCTGGTSCAARLTLTTIETITGKHGKKTKRTVTLGTATPAFPIDSIETIKISLNATGRRLFAAGHGHLTAKLTIHQIKGSGLTNADVVRLVGQAGFGSKKGGK
jgi:hypothetical protein